MIPRVELHTGDQMAVRLAHFGQCRAEVVATDRERGGVLVSSGTCGASVVLELVNASGPDARGIDHNNQKGA